MCLLVFYFVPLQVRSFHPPPVKNYGRHSLLIQQIGGIIGRTRYPMQAFRLNKYVRVTSVLKIGLCARQWSAALTKGLGIELGGGTISWLLGRISR